METTILNYYENTLNREFIGQAIYTDDGTYAFKWIVNYLDYGSVYKSDIKTTIITKDLKKNTYNDGEKYDEFLVSYAISPKTVSKYYKDFKSSLESSSSPEKNVYDVIQLNGNTLEKEYYEELNNIFFSKSYISKPAIDKMHELANAFYNVQSLLSHYDKLKKSAQSSNHRIIDITNELREHYNKKLKNHFNNRNSKYFN